MKSQGGCKVFSMEKDDDYNVASPLFCFIVAAIKDEIKYNQDLLFRAQIGQFT